MICLFFCFDVTSETCDKTIKPPPPPKKPPKKLTFKFYDFRKIGGTFLDLSRHQCYSRLEKKNSPASLGWRALRALTQMHAYDEWVGSLFTNLQLCSSVLCRAMSEEIHLNDIEIFSFERDRYSKRKSWLFNILQANHTNNFVDPVTVAHTPRMWRTLRRMLLCVLFVFFTILVLVQQIAYYSR